MVCNHLCTWLVSWLAAWLAVMLLQPAGSSSASSCREHPGVMVQLSQRAQQRAKQDAWLLCRRRPAAAPVHWLETGGSVAKCHWLIFCVFRVRQPLLGGWLLAVTAQECAVSGW